MQLPNQNRLRRRHLVLDEQHLKTLGADKNCTKLGVPDVPKYDSESEKESWGDSGEEDEDDENDSEDKSNDGKNDDDDDNQEGDDTNDDDEETDSDRTESDRIKDSCYAHVTLTPVLDTQKANELVQSSSVSSDFTSKLLNLENPSPADNEIASLMETSSHHATAVPEVNPVSLQLILHHLYSSILFHNKQHQLQPNNF
ncbi:hypothetical protein Tco_1368542 [Tanacetum coccineum]